MENEEQILFGVVVLFLCVSLVGFLLIVLDYISKSLDKHNTNKAIEFKEKYNVKHTEEVVKLNDYEIEFNINLKDSIVRTEVVYTE